MRATTDTTVVESAPDDLKQEVGLDPLFLFVVLGIEPDRKVADMDVAGLIRQAWQLMEKDLASLGYELVEIDMSKQGSSALLRVFIDKDLGGISLDDCTRATHLLNILLDDADFIDGRYILEVSSPGINRPVRKPKHFERYAGEQIRIETHAPLDGRTRIRGRLLGLQTDMVRVDVSGQELTIHLDNVKKARLDR